MDMKVNKGKGKGIDHNLREFLQNKTDFFLSFYISLSLTLSLSLSLPLYSKPPIIQVHHYFPKCSSFIPKSIMLTPNIFIARPIINRRYTLIKQTNDHHIQLNEMSCRPFFESETLFSQFS